MKMVKESKKLEAEYMKSYLPYLESIEEGEKRAAERWQTVVSEKDSLISEQNTRLDELTAQIQSLTAQLAAKGG